MRVIQVRIAPDAMPEWWLARQRELQEAREADDGDRGPILGSMTREEAEQALGGSIRQEDV